MYPLFFIIDILNQVDRLRHKHDGLSIAHEPKLVEASPQFRALRGMRTLGFGAFGSSRSCKNSELPEDSQPRTGMIWAYLSITYKSMVSALT
jgi:hypothetical protein